MYFKDKAASTLDEGVPGKQGLDFKQLFSNSGFLLFLVTMALSFWLYWDGLAEAVLRWELQEEYSHGYLIPLVSLFILWEKRFQIASQLPRLFLVGSADNCAGSDYFTGR